MLDKRNAAKHEQLRYATPANFCRIFEQNMDRLYLLSFLLTGNHSLAEKCFVGGLADASNGNAVFLDWAESWAARKIVENAVEMVRPRAAATALSQPMAESHMEAAITEPREWVRILALPALERFAFVLSVLERYSDQECASILGCTQSELAAARVRALLKTGKPAEPYRSENLPALDGGALWGRN